MNRFPQTNAQFIAVLVVAVGAISALAVFQRSSSISSFLKADTARLGGVCYIGNVKPSKNGDLLTQCVPVTSAEECQAEASGRPFLIVPGGTCPNLTNADSCTRAGTELLWGERGSGAGATKEHALESARQDCATKLISTKEYALKCPVQCTRYIKYFAAKCAITGESTGGDDPDDDVFVADCTCSGLFACTQQSPRPEPIPVPLPDGQPPPPTDSPHMVF